MLSLGGEGFGDEENEEKHRKVDAGGEVEDGEKAASLFDDSSSKDGPDGDTL